jgi:hypothetical protein
MGENRIIGRALEFTIIWAIELRRRISIWLFGIVEGGTATSPSTVVVSGVVTGIRLLVVMVLKIFLRAVILSGYIIRPAGSGLSRSA